MIRISGCLILVLCCYFLGWLKASSYKRRCAELENVIEVLKLLEMQITYKKEPLAKSFYKLSETRTCWFGSLLGQCSENLASSKSLENSWQEGLELCRSDSPLNEKDMAILNDLVMGLGKCDTEGQKKLFEPTLMRLEMNLKEACIQERKQGKMYISLSTAAGVVISVILI